jgi:hypothetical protein
MNLVDQQWQGGWVGGEPVIVNVDEAGSTWDPATAVVYADRTGGECTGPSALLCCGHMTFSPPGQRRQHGQHPIRRSPAASWTKAAPCKEASASSVSYSASPSRASKLGPDGANQTRHRLIGAHEPRRVRCGGRCQPAEASQGIPGRTGRIATAAGAGDPGRGAQPSGARSPTGRPPGARRS